MSKLPPAALRAGDRPGRAGDGGSRGASGEIQLRPQQTASLRVPRASLLSVTSRARGGAAALGMIGPAVTEGAGVYFNYREHPSPAAPAAQLLASTFAQGWEAGSRGGRRSLLGALPACLLVLRVWPVGASRREVSMPVRRASVSLRSPRRRGRDFGVLKLQGEAMRVLGAKPQSTSCPSSPGAGLSLGERAAPLLGKKND